jgi:small subunit ribosomal protein S18
MSDEFSGGPRRSGGDRSERGERSGGGSFGGFRGRRKSCPFSSKDAPKIDYKDVRLLQRFVSERGKMMPSRITAVSAKHQRTLTQAIKRARFLALLPYADKKSGG